jgi:hypothetical protein
MLRTLIVGLVAAGWLSACESPRALPPSGMYLCDTIGQPCPLGYECLIGNDQMPRCYTAEDSTRPRDGGPGDAAAAGPDGTSGPDQPMAGPPPVTCSPSTAAQVTLDLPDLKSGVALCTDKGTPCTVCRQADGSSRWTVFEYPETACTCPALPHEENICDDIARRPEQRCVTGCVYKECGADDQWHCPPGTFDRTLCIDGEPCQNLAYPALVYCKNYCDGIRVFHLTCEADGSWRCEGEIFDPRTCPPVSCTGKTPSYEEVCVTSCGTAAQCADGAPAAQWYCPEGLVDLGACQPG